MFYRNALVYGSEDNVHSKDIPTLHLIETGFEMMDQDRYLLATTLRDSNETLDHWINWAKSQAGLGKKHGPRQLPASAAPSSSQLPPRLPHSLSSPCHSHQRQPFKRHFDPSFLSIFVATLVLLCITFCHLALYRSSRAKLATSHTLLSACSTSRLAHQHPQETSHLRFASHKFCLISIRLSSRLPVIIR